LHLLRQQCPDVALSALDPGKQGLKHSILMGNATDPALSALDPGKQGLKLP